MLLHLKVYCVLDDVLYFQDKKQDEAVDTLRETVGPPTALNSYYYIWHFFNLEC